MKIFYGARLNTGTNLKAGYVIYNGDFEVAITFFVNKPEVFFIEPGKRGDFVHPKKLKAMGFNIVKRLDNSIKYEAIISIFNGRILNDN